jgi:hypothetical protein
MLSSNAKMTEVQNRDQQLFDDADDDHPHYQKDHVKVDVFQRPLKVKDEQVRVDHSADERRTQDHSRV